MKLTKLTLSKVSLPSWGWHLPSVAGDHALTESLSRFGQLLPILVRKTSDGYEVIDGRRRVRIAKELGLEALYGRVLDCTEQEARLYAITAGLSSEYDYVQLATEMRVLLGDRDRAEFCADVAAVSPWTPERIHYFLSLLHFDWSQFAETAFQSGFFDEEMQQETYDPSEFTQEEEPEPVPEVPVVTKRRQPTARRAVPLDFLEVTVETKGGPEDPPEASVAALHAPTEADRRPPVPTPLPEAGSRRTGAARPFLAEVLAVDVPTASTEMSGNQTDGIRTQVLLGETFSLGRPAQTWTPPEPPVLDNVSAVELDTETTGLKWWDGHRPIGIALRTEDGRKFYLPWGHAGGNLDEAVVKRWAQRELRNKHITNTNIGFDLHMMREWGVDLEAQGCTFGDVQHYAALLDENRKQFGLDVLARDFAIEAAKITETVSGQMIDKTDMAGYHAGDVAEYAMRDVESVAQLRQKMWPLLTAQDLHRVRELEEQVIPVVVEMEKNSAFIDTITLNKWVAQSAEELREMLWTISREVGFSVNPDRSGDWERLFKHFNIPITQYTEKGAPSFADSVLAGIDHPTVQLLRKAGKLASLRSKFLTAYHEVVGEDGKLRFALHQLRGDEYGTIRGRFSMAGKSRVYGAFGANLQQVYSVERQREAFGIDRDDASHDDEIYIIRKLFIPEDGVYCSNDAQSIEYRLAAHFAEAKSLLRAYEADWKKIKNPELRDGKWVDFHQVVQDIVKPYKDISRKTTKNLNFLRIYGGGEEKAAATLGLSLTETRKILSVYDRKFPEFSSLRRRLTTRAKKTGFVTTLYGRRSRFDSEAFTHKAINYVIQGSAADIMKAKLVELHKERKWTGFVMRQTVHDEVDGDATTPETADRVNEILNRQTFDTKVPIVWQTRTGANWSEC